MDNKLAILGGTPVTTKQWPFYNSIGEEEIAAANVVLRSGVLSDFYGSPGERFLGGPEVRAFEGQWSSYFGVKHSVSMNSLTSCLHAALAVCGVSTGDEVIVPQLGMSAAAAVVLALGAKPVFVDCVPHRMTICPRALSQAVNARTKAGIVVHLTGVPADMDEIKEAAAGVPIIEDNAQAPAAKYHGKFAGTLADIGCFSLNCHKIIQCGEGGVACTNRDELALGLQLFRNHGERSFKQLGGKLNWGLNLRLTELQAAIAAQQLLKLEKLNSEVVFLCRYLCSALNLPGIIAPQVPSDRTHVYYILHFEYQESVVGVPAARFAEALEAEGVPFYAHYGYLMSEQFGMELNQHYPGAEQAIKDSLWTMMIRPGLTVADMDVVVEAMNKVYQFRHIL